MTHLCVADVGAWISVPFLWASVICSAPLCVGEQQCERRRAIRGLCDSAGWRRQREPNVQPHQGMPLPAQEPPTHPTWGERPGEWRLQSRWDYWVLSLQWFIHYTDLYQKTGVSFWHYWCIWYYWFKLILWMYCSIIHHIPNISDSWLFPNWWYFEYVFHIANSSCQCRFSFAIPLNQTISL